jgi:predicted aminopeptidase
LKSQRLDVARGGGLGWWLLMGAGGLLLAWGLGAVALCLSSGCTSISYYAQAAGGHMELIRLARPVADVVADANTPAPLQKRLALSQDMRNFASAELKLPDNNSYRRYADLQREAVVWNVVAAPALSLTLQTWCFPVMGCVGYRGYFNREGADALATQLKAQGLEVSVYGVPAYSTLGWSNWLGGDPLLNTFVNWSEAELAGLIFHEISHQVAYAADDTTFNESFATAVERIGRKRWLAQRGNPQAAAAQALSEHRRQDFRALTQRYRDELKSLYESDAATAIKLERKASVMAALRTDYEQLKATERWTGYSGYDAWFAKANNASFGVLSAYNELVPQFEKLFEDQGGDFSRFYATVQGLAALPKDERRAKLSAKP